MVLFVCTGNTCRSPMAEAICNARGYAQAESAGLFAPEGSPAAENAVAAALALGADASRHRARNVTPGLLIRAEKVYAMTKAHAARLAALYPQFAGKITTLHEAALLPGEVDDPFMGSPDRYLATAKEIAGLLEKIFEAEV